MDISQEDCLASVEVQHTCLEEAEGTILEVGDMTAEDYNPVGLLGGHFPFRAFVVLLDWEERRSLDIPSWLGDRSLADEEALHRMNAFSSVFAGS